MKYYNFITTNNITILYNYYIIKINLYIRVIFFIKLNKRIRRLMRKRKRGASEGHISWNLAA